MSEHQLRAIWRNTLAVLAWVAACTTAIVTGLPQ